MKMDCLILFQTKLHLLIEQQAFASLDYYLTSDLLSGMCLELYGSWLIQFLMIGLDQLVFSDVHPCNCCSTTKCYQEVKLIRIQHSDCEPSWWSNLRTYVLAEIEGLGPDKVHKRCPLGDQNQLRT